MEEGSECKTFCNRCSHHTTHSILYSNEIFCEEEDWREKGEKSYYVVRCLGCDDIHFIYSLWRTMETDEEGNPTMKYLFYPPRSFRKIPAWLIEMDNEWEVKQLLEEVYSAFASENLRLASMGIRAALEFFMIEMVGDKGSFSRNINEFERQGCISKIQINSLKSVLEIGHAAIHRGYRPQLSELLACLDICESIIETIVNSQNFRQLGTDVPPRKC